MSWWDSMKRRVERTSDRWLFVAVAVATLLLAFAFIWPRQWTNGLLINDEMWHAHLARNVYLGNGYVTDSLAPMHVDVVEKIPAPALWKQPAYSVLVGWLWWITGVRERTMLVVSLLSLALATALTYALGRSQRFAKGTSLLAAGTFATAHTPLAMQTTALPEALFVACFLGAILLVLRPRRINLFLAGVLLALLVLVKGHGLILLPAFFLLLALAAPERLRSLGIFCSGLVGGIVAAWLFFPAHAVRLLRAGGTYSLGFVWEVGSYYDGPMPYSQVDPPDPWQFILADPAAYLEKVARMVRRTKVVMDALSEPALSGVLFPLLWLSLLVLAYVLFFRPALRGKLEGDAHIAEEGTHPGMSTATVAIFFAGLILLTFGFFWSWRLTGRYILHLFPLMLYTIGIAGRLFRPALRAIDPALRSIVSVAVVGYLCLYPAASALWLAYRHPHEFLGRALAVRFLDYDRMAELVERHVPDGAIVVSDMNHEIAWLNRRGTIAFPATEEGLRHTLDRFDAQALYEHPLFLRDWPILEQQFELIDDSNGRLWVKAIRRAP